MSSYYIWTIGCQMNKADSADLAARLDDLGFIPAETVDEADVVVVNSCVVRQSAENRVLAKLDSLARPKRLRPEMTIALMGCMVGPEADELMRRFPHVDAFVSPGRASELVEIASRRPVDRIVVHEAPSRPPCAYVTVIEGCDNFCSYCIVPYRRGRERSREMKEVLLQLEELVAGGVREVTLLGQNVNSYGHDLPGGPDLADLLGEVNAVSGLERIRFLTSHPKDMSDRLIQAVGSLSKVCEVVSLPVQAGDDDVLRAMGRGYTSRFYRELVERMRDEIPGVALSTDVVVGFPGETDEQYRRTLDLLSGVRFDSLHIAAYSPRPGTAAAETLEDSVPLSVKKARLREAEELQRGIAAEINGRLLGHSVEVLVEGEKQGKWHGRTRTGKLVFFRQDADCLGQLVDVRITKTSPWSLQGDVSRHRHEG
ncbi:MAG: tRNA (N6-isopentenyl adenosine(37)-C2)-methylthiotransferase MiaB [Gemmatimonadota bacterium]|nr:MAG: tRNA (N6-isopentenyl adenosine(37)-C2)-methylthiotransferase MiaB [Gemmatimonadota bacterium]